MRREYIAALAILASKITSQLTSKPPVMTAASSNS